MKRFFVLFSMILFFVGSTFVTTALTEKELRDTISSVNKQLEQIEKEIKDYNTKINATQGEALSLKAAIKKLESQRTALLKQIDMTELQLRRATSDLLLTEVDIASTTRRLITQEKGMHEILRELERSSNLPPPFVQSFTSSATFSDALTTSTSLDELRRSVAIRMRELSSTRLDLEDEKENQEIKKRNLAELKSTLSSQKEVVDANSKEKSTLLEITKNKESEYQRLVRERREKKKELEKELGDFEAKLKVIVDASKLPKFGSGVLSWPLKKVTITQTFGTTPFASQNPQVYNGSGHNGIDLAAPVGTQLFSALRGTVVGVGNTDTACSGASYGKWVLIRHQNGLTTLYAHLSTISVTAGQSVEGGERIGLTGNTGYSTGPHLHFAVFASDAVRVTGPTEYRSRSCGSYMVLPVSPRNGYLNPLSYL